MENSIIHPAPPLFAGLHWRVITPDNLNMLVRLAAECHLVDGGLAFMNELDNLESRYFPDLPGAAVGAFTIDERLVACAAVHLARKSDTEQAIIVGQVHPELRQRGIGTYLLRWSQVQAQVLFSAATTGNQVLQIATESLTEPANYLYQKHGFAHIFESLVMQRDIRQPLPNQPLSNGVTLTNWQPELAEQFFQAYHAAFHERPGFPGWRAAEWIDQVLANDFKPEWSFLARTDDVPLGFVIGTIDLTTDPPGGFVWQIGVIPAWRRRGLGSVLMIETMKQMQAARALTAQLTVNVNNPGAIQTYEHLGFVTVGRRARYERQYLPRSSF